MESQPTPSNDEQTPTANAGVETKPNLENPPANAGDDVNERLLKESKKFKEKWQTAQKERDALLAEKEEAERKTLEDQARYRELYEKTKGDLDKERTAVRTERKLSSIRAKAQEMGCRDVDLVVQLGRDDGLIQWSEDERAFHGVETFLESLKETKPYLFEQSSTPTINATVPSGKPRAAAPVTLKEAVSSAEGFSAALMAAENRKRG